MYAGYPANCDAYDAACNGRLSQPVKLIGSWPTSPVVQARLKQLRNKLRRLQQLNMESEPQRGDASSHLRLG